MTWRSNPFRAISNRCAKPALIFDASMRRISMPTSDGRFIFDFILPEIYQATDVRMRLEALGYPWVELGPHVHKPPLLWLCRFAEFAFSRRAYELVLQPKLADAQIEHFDALAEQRFWKARWVRTRDTIGIITVMAMQCPISLAKIVLNLWKVAGS